MTATTDRPRIPTENELYGDGVLDEAGGIWVVLDHGYGNTTVTFVATNRQAAEDAIHGKCESNGRDVGDFSIQVWSPQDAYPGGDE